MPAIKQAGIAHIANVAAKTIVHPNEPSPAGDGFSHSGINAKTMERIPGAIIAIIACIIIGSIFLIAHAIPTEMETIRIYQVGLVTVLSHVSIEWSDCLTVASTLSKTGPVMDFCHY